MSALASPVALDDVLARGDVWRGNGLASLPDGVLPSGFPELDAELPGGGWPQGCLTEILTEQHGCGELSLLLPSLARLSANGSWLALLAPPFLPFAPAWSAAGIALERLVIVRPGRDFLWSLEQLLASEGFSAILAWSVPAIDPQRLRRLQLAVEGRRVFACLWRSTASAGQASPAALRLAVQGTESALSVRILKRRGAPATRPLRLPIVRPAGRLSG